MSTLEFSAFVADSFQTAAMAIHLATCKQCGLTATCITSGDRVVTSFSTEQAALMCSEGRFSESEALENVVHCAAVEEALNKPDGVRALAR